MKLLLMGLAESGILRIVLSTVALASGLDDLIEVWFGVEDVLRLDVAHGIVLTAFTGILDPICKLIEQSESKLKRVVGEGGAD